MNTRLLSVKEVAHLLGKSEKWVYKHKESLPGFFNLAGSMFFDEEVLSSSLKHLATKKTVSVRRQESRDKHGLLP